MGGDTDDGDGRGFREELNTRLDDERSGRVIRRGGRTGPSGEDMVVRWRGAGRGGRARTQNEDGEGSRRSHAFEVGALAARQAVGRVGRLGRVSHAAARVPCSQSPFMPIPSLLQLQHALGLPSITQLLCYACPPHESTHQAHALISLPKLTFTTIEVTGHRGCCCGAKLAVRVGAFKRSINCYSRALGSVEAGRVHCAKVAGLAGVRLPPFALRSSSTTSAAAARATLHCISQQIFRSTALPPTAALAPPERAARR
jgi:hypothetical protein